MTKADTAIDALDTLRINLAEIEVPSTNPRLKEAENADELRALADDMAMNGQLQPIGVVPDGNAFVLVWGARRLAAARMLGWKTVAAVAVDRALDHAQIAAAENLHRRAMNPLEEALAVETLLERHRSLPPADAQRLVGEALGKSPTWVRDRLFLSRLGPEGRAKVIDGTMPLGIARELAKVVDHRTQKRLLERWYGKHSDPIDVDYARAEANQVALSLDQVPWLLESAGVAKGCPACAGCPSNTANAAQSMLFEHDDKSSMLELGEACGADPLGRRPSYSSERNPGPFCLDQGCFERKAKAATAALAGAAKAAATARKPAERLEKAVEKAPVWMPTEAIAKAVEKPPAVAKAVDEPKKPESQQDWKTRQAKLDKLRKEREAAKRKESEEVLACLEASPGALAALYILSELGYGPHFGNLRAHQAKVRDKAPVPGKLRELASAMATGDVTLTDLDDLVRVRWDKGGRDPWDRLLDGLGRAGKDLLRRTFAPLSLGEAAQRAPAKDPTKPTAKAKAPAAKKKPKAAKAGKPKRK